jgi:hypothetical protein
VDYDFKRVWFSPEAERIRTSIRNRECYCPLANASYTNMLMHAPTLARVSAKVALTSLPVITRHHDVPAETAPGEP